MSDGNLIIPPHLNAEVYRNETNTSNSMTNLDYIRIHDSDGTTLIGCSELTGRYWNGGVKILKSPDEGDTDKLTFILPSGTANGCFLESSGKVLICQDNGSVGLWARGTGAWSMWDEEMTVTEHDDAVLAVDCLEPDNFYVTAGADGNIKIWDINNMICETNYLHSHSMLITGVAAKPNTMTFASSSLDRYVSLWDKNSKDKVLNIAISDAGVRCLEWVDENRLLMGDEAGVLSIIDIRSMKNALSLVIHPAPVHRIVAHKGSNKVAACCDNRILSVYELSDDNQLKLVFKDNSHKNYVRDVAWTNGTDDKLHTVGWDGAIKSHLLS